MKKALTAQCELKKFTNTTGESIEYVDISLIVDGISLKLSAKDSTAKEILKKYLKGGN